MIRLRYNGWRMRALLPGAPLRLLRDYKPSRNRTMGVPGVFAAASLVVVSVSATNASTAVSLRPVADASVNSTYPTTNYGTNLVLHVDGSPVTTGYLRFDLRGVSGTVTNATLQLYANSSDATGISVHPVTNTTWSETTLTYVNAPAMGGASVSSGAITAGSTVSLTVTSLVSAGRLVTLGLTDRDATCISLGSRESAHPPVLALTVSTAVVAPTPTNQPAPVSTPVPAPTVAPTTGAPSGPPTSANPIRAAFYYPWFPLGWKQQGIYPYTNYHPSVGFYDGGSSAVVAAQIKAMQYGKISVGIASWWGQGSQTDQKIPMLLGAASGTGFKWAFYFELEGTTDPSSASIASDLAYINSHYGSNPNVEKIDGRPVIFVYGGPSDNCNTASRWKAGNAAAHDYVVLKVFPGYASCASQPDQWHQYSPAVPEDHQAGRTFSISPGFWLKGTPMRLARNVTRWQQDVRDMTASHEPWQLVTTFNEWGEGTAVESATEWATSSGYGAYLDALHNY